MVATATPFSLRHGHQQVESLAGLHLAESVACIERKNAACATVDGELGLGIDEAGVDSLQINIQPGDAMRGNAMQIGINQRLGKQRRIVGG